jgi:hypothetical protein
MVVCDRICVSVVRVYLLSLYLECTRCLPSPPGTCAHGPHPFLLYTGVGCKHCVDMPEDKKRGKLARQQQFEQQGMDQFRVFAPKSEAERIKAEKLAAKAQQRLKQQEKQ